MSATNLAQASSSCNIEAYYTISVTSANFDFSKTPEIPNTLETFKSGVRKNRVWRPNWTEWYSTGRFVTLVALSTGSMDIGCYTQTPVALKNFRDKLTTTSF